MSPPNPAAYPEAYWRKSSYSGGANDCVEIANLDSFLAIRDSKKPWQHILARREQLQAMVNALKTQALD